MQKNLPSVIDKTFILDLDKDPEYTLEIDPLGIYNMTDTQKMFVKNYIELGNIPLAAKMSGIDEKLAREYFSKHSVRKEIDRIYMALYQRRFASKMLTLEELGAYLTTQLTDQFVPLKDRLSSKDKLSVAKMIMDIHKMKQESLNQPAYIDAIEIENQLKDLSIESISSLIDASNNVSKIEKNMTDKDEIINAINEIHRETENRGLTPEEISFMKSQSLNELMDLLEIANGKGEADGK